MSIVVTDVFKKAFMAGTKNIGRADTLKIVR
jgi:hypothetical protein